MYLIACRYVKFKRQDYRCSNCNVCKEKYPGFRIFVTKITTEFKDLIKFLNQLTFHFQIYIHGGGYTRGTSGSFDGHMFVAAAGGDVILITINYRLYELGFLVTRDESVRGKKTKRFI